MNILVCSPFLNYRGHFQRITATRAEAMARAGLNVTIFGFPEKPELHYEDAPLPYVSVCGELMPQRRVRVERLRQRWGHYWLFVIETFWTQRAALRWGKAHGFDLVYITDADPWTLIPAFLSSDARRRMPVVAYIPYAFYIPSLMRVRPWYARWRGRLNTWAAAWLPRMLHVACDNPSVSKALRMPRTKRIHLVPEGHHVLSPLLPQADARRRLNLPLDRRALLLFGSASLGKGADLLFQALENVPPAWDLYVVGETGGEYSTTWGDLEPLKRRGWEGHLHVVSRFVTEEERKLFFTACDAVVLPHRYGYTTTSGGLRDAIDYGKALIVSDQFHLGHMVRTHELGLTFRPEDVEDLRRALQDLFAKSDAWFQEIAARCRTVVEEYSWDRIGERYRRLFEELAGRMDDSKTT